MRATFITLPSGRMPSAVSFPSSLAGDGADGAVAAGGNDGS